ncbi:peptidyl-alpha-hydroxyglycine alpha-amidating lyase family protein [Fulvivirga sedimenti]|uniref:Peptidyl-alpha-hydroxyglycine alpha-amidating lyase family protein n=1 Tax=Fulvivirga sedimenti TaxID=2879465 RepID=A0A9X1L3B4_9BACT|nr:peptidyl-alpha-hydroxyglycine alpha-amidating lyase family protein [Fulvivirga sedimenti]MCA6079126.1 peptidyl-alpha-hydroxyglycine alpha-amidating lyase family protein [Fulvivirga sedimenti]
MKINLLSITSIFLITLIGCKNQTAETESASTSAVAYSLMQDWPDLPDSIQLGNATGLDIDKHGHLFVFHRAGRQWTDPFPEDPITRPTIFMLDAESGNLINSWGEDLFIMPHGLTADKENNVWMTDVARHQVFKFSHEGELLLTLGEEGIYGTDSSHFYLPTDIAIASNGNIYVSDGYGNSRVIVFDPSGKYLFDWGIFGDLPGQFNTPHGIDIDEEGNVYVADRENNRIQKFSAEGEFIKLWQNEEGEQLYSVVTGKNGDVFGIDYHVVAESIVKGSDIIHLDALESVLNRYGRNGNYNGEVVRYHDIAIDEKGNLYTADILENTIQKFNSTK